VGIFVGVDCMFRCGFCLGMDWLIYMLCVFCCRRFCDGSLFRICCVVVCFDGCVCGG